MVRGNCVKNYKAGDRETLHPYNDIAWWNTSECEYKSIARFNGPKRTLKNIACVDYLLVADIDGGISPNKLKEFEAIFALPKLTIIKSTDITSELKKVQLLSPLKYPVTPELFPLYRLVQDGVTRLLEDSGINGVDHSVVGDLTRFVRNPNGKNRRNLKPGNNSPVEGLQDGEPTTLSEWYYILKDLGCIVQPEIKQSPRIPLAHSFNIVRKYFRKQGRVEGTDAEVSERLGIPLRTYQLIKASLDGKEIIVKQVGNNKAGNPRRSVIVSLFSGPHKKNSKDNTTGGGEYITKNSKSILQEFKGKTVNEGERNKIAFAIALNLKITSRGKISESECFAVLKKHINFRDLHTFPDSEIRMCIKSAFNNRYQFPISRTKLRSPEWGLI